ncbi:hypothetical protein [Tunicatimonas pelagia]|uniref:hypothetical protein n=1 Tax=Tunicatimonas pelagia TaxID=931531 RepID=UPI003F540613
MISTAYGDGLIYRSTLPRRKPTGRSSMPWTRLVAAESFTCIRVPTCYADKSRCLPTLRCAAAAREACCNPAKTTIPELFFWVEMPTAQ